MLGLALAPAIGCTPPAPPPAPAVVTVVPPPTAEPGPTPTAEAPAPSGPKRVELRPGPACIVEGAWRPLRGAATLHVTPEGPAFATATGGTGRLHVPESRARPAWTALADDPPARPAMQGLELSADGLSVQGYIESSASDLRAARTFLFSGLALPTPRALLQWVEATPGQITVTVEPPKALTVLAPPLTATRPCADLQLGAPSFEATDSIDGYSKSKPGQLRLGAPIDVALTPGGSPVARAEPSAAQENVRILETRGAHTRVAWPIGALVVVGWVPSRAVHPPSKGYGFGSGHGTLGGGRGGDRHKRVVCPGDVDLLVEIGSEVWIPGLIRAGTVIELTSLNDSTTRIDFRSRSLQPAPDAQWMVRTGDVAGCPDAD